MNEERIRLSYDHDADVLYVRDLVGEIVRSSPVEGDDFVIRNLDALGRVVGLQLIAVSDLDARRWRAYFSNEEEIPRPFFDAVDSWLSRRDFTPTGVRHAMGFR